MPTAENPDYCGRADEDNPATDEPVHLTACQVDPMIGSVKGARRNDDKRAPGGDHPGARVCLLARPQPLAVLPCCVVRADSASVADSEGRENYPDRGCADRDEGEQRLRVGEEDRGEQLEGCDDRD